MKQDAKASTGNPWALLSPTRNIFWFAALAVVLAILLHDSLFTGKGLVAADGILNLPPWNRPVRASNPVLSDQYFVFLPTQEFAHQQKSFPLWNPDLCCGVPNLGAIQGALLFPIRLLLSPLDPFAASALSAFLKLWLAGCFTLLYVRLLGVPPAGAFLAGLVFSLSGFMIVWLGHPHVNSAMWLPLLLYFVEKSVRDGSSHAVSAPALRAWIGFAIAFAFMILGGHPPTMVHVTIVVVIYFLFRLIELGPRQALARTGLLAGAVAVGLLLAAPQILPFLEYYRHSSSIQSSELKERWSYHLNGASLIHFLLPNVMGNPAVGFENLRILLGWPKEANFNERTGYVGILPLFFAANAIAQRRCRFTGFFFVLAIGSMLVAYGVPPFPALLRSMPILSSINQIRLLLIVGFCVAVLAGLGWQAWSGAMARRPTLLAAAGFGVLVVVSLFCFWRSVAPSVPTLDSSHWGFLARQFLVLGGGVTAAVLLAVWPARWQAWMAMTLALCWTAADLLCFGTGYNPAIARDLYYPRTSAIEWLQQDHSLFRVFGGAMLSPDSAEVFGLSDARGMDFMTVRRYEELITGEAGDFLFYQNPKSFPKTFLLLNVKYVLSPTSTPLDSQSFELVYSKEILIYRYKPCRERALLLFDYQVETNASAVLSRVASPGFDPRRLLLLEDQPSTSQLPAAGRPDETNTAGSVRVLSYEPDDIKISASLPRPGYLLLLDTYFPGWSATVNGQGKPIHRADYNFRAVELPAGTSTICFSYRPESLRIGLYLCAAGVLGLGAAWTLSVKVKSNATIPNPNFAHS